MKKEKATIPADWYNVVMDQSEIKPTYSGNGAYLHCRFNILDGEYIGRKLFADFHLEDVQKVEFKKADAARFSAVAHAVGVMQVGNNSDLHGKPLKVKVDMLEAKGKRDASNVIKAYRDINDSVAGL